MKKLLLVMIAVASIAAACGDSSDAGGDSVAAYCKLSAENEAADDFLDDSDFSAEAMEQGFSEMAALMNEGLLVAPSEIKDDFKAMVTQFDVLIAGLKEVDYNFAALDPESLAFLTDPELAAASDRLDAWSEENC